MLKEIDYWLKMSGSNHTSSTANENYGGSILTNAFGSSNGKKEYRRAFDIINFNEGDTQDDQIEMSNHIHSQGIDYLKTF
jgi:hypothetical protein